MSRDRSSSLGAMYESNARSHAPAMPSVPGSIGTAYEAWVEADQEAQWLANIESRRDLASSDATQVIALAEVEEYRRQVAAERAWDADADDAVHVVGGQTLRERREALARAHESRADRRDSQTRPPKKTRRSRFLSRQGSRAVDSPEFSGGTPTSDEGTHDVSRRSADSSSAQAQSGEQKSQASQSDTGDVVRSSAIMAAGTLVSRILGLLRTSLTLAALGTTTGISNTWAVANTLPNIIYLLLAGGVINAVLVPQITRALEHKDGGKAYTDRIVTLTLSLLFGVTVIFMAAAPLVYWMYDHNTHPAGKAHVAWMFTIICLPQIFFYGLYTIFGQILNARGRFGAFMWSPALANIVIIAGLIWFMAAYPHGQRNVHQFPDWTLDAILLLAVPATLGIVAQALVLIPVLARAGYRYTPNFQFRGVGLRSASTMAGWAFAAVIIQQGGFILTTQLLSSQPDGAPGTAAQGSAFLLFTLPHSLVTLSLVTALFTGMSVAANRGQTDKVKADMTMGIRLSGLASVMLTFGCFALVYPLVGAMFGSADSTLWSIGSMAMAMMVGLVPFSLCLVIQRVFYAYNDAKTPFWMQLICTGTAVVLTIPWFWLRSHHMLGDSGYHWVGVGVGLAQTLSNLAQAIIGYIWLRRRIGHIPMRETVRTYVRLAIGAILATIVGLVVSHFVSHLMAAGHISSFINLAITGSIFLAIYIGVAHRLRVTEINQLLSPVTRRLKRS